MSSTPGCNVHKDTVNKLCVFLKGSIYQSVLCLSQRDGIGCPCLKLLATLRIVFCQLTNLNLVTQKVVEKQVCSPFVLPVTKHDISLSTLCYSTLEEILLMTEKYILLVCSGFQGTDTGNKIVTDILCKAMNTE